MALTPFVDVLVSGFLEEEGRALDSALAAQGRSARQDDPIECERSQYVFAAAYDERSLRAQRAAALEDPRPWCFCIRQQDRSLLAQASLAREGKLLILPPEDRELKRLLSALAEEARLRSSGGATFQGLSRLEADFAWRTSSFEISAVARRIASLLEEAGFYESRAGTDECALSLEEALVNSVEHGNLELDSALRPEDPLQEDRYEAEKARRLADPAYGDRLVRISLAMAMEEAVITIEDAGTGFDTSKLDASPTGLAVSGKGFWLIKKPFDEAVYNEEGNALTLTRRRPADPELRGSEGGKLPGAR